MPMPAARASRVERKVNKSAVDTHFAGVAPVDAGDYLHQRALAGPVLAGNAMDEPGLHLKSTPRNAWTPPKRFRNACKFEGRGARHCPRGVRPAQIRN